MPILYSCKTATNGFTFVKFDEDFNLASIYTITIEGNRMSCDCPGWPRRNVCKHTRMLPLFAKAGFIDTSLFYCYETQNWHQPIAGPWDQDDPTARKAAELEAEGPSSELCMDEGCPQFPTEHVCISTPTEPPLASPPPKSFIRRV